MTHLTSEQLSAHLDRALSGSAAEAAERHLDECQDCRDAFAALAAQDAGLRPVLSHDPGDAYFEELPSRVSARILTEQMAAPPREPFSFARLFQSPRSLAWVGSAAVVVAGAGVVLMTANQVETPDLRDHDVMARSEHGQPHAAAPQEAEREVHPVDKPAAPPSARQETPTARTRRDKSMSANLPPASDEVRKSASGERKAAANQGFATPPPPAPRSGVAQSKDADDRATGTSTLAGADAKGQSTASRAAPPPAPAREQQLQAKGGRANEGSLNKAAEPAPVRNTAPPPAQTAAKEKQDQASKRAAAPAVEENRYREESAKLGANKTESGAKAPAPSTAPAPPAAQSLAPSTTGATSAADAVSPRSVRLCGTVRDSDDRPISGALVEITLLHIGTTTDLRGEFCLDVPAGHHRVTVMSVGFTSTTQTLQAAAGEPRARITLSTVPVLTKPLVRPMPAKPTAPTPPPAPKSDPFATLSESQRTVVRSAQQAQTKAEQQPDPGTRARLYDDAANSWQKALKMLTGQPAELETRWRMAESRFYAWEYGPTSRRQSAAIEALTAYAGRAPGGPERERATRMLDRIQH